MTKHKIMCLVRAPVRCSSAIKWLRPTTQAHASTKAQFGGALGQEVGNELPLTVERHIRRNAVTPHLPLHPRLIGRRLCAHCAQHTGAPPPPAPLGPSGLPRVLFSQNLSDVTAENGSEDGRTSSTALKLGEAVPGEPGGGLLIAALLLTASRCLRKASHEVLTAKSGAFPRVPLSLPLYQSTRRYK